MVELVAVSPPTPCSLELRYPSGYVIKLTDVELTAGVRAPLMRALGTWATEVAPSIVSGSPLGKAWVYLNNQWPRLQVFLRDGNVNISNAAAERGLRRITIGRKLWLLFQNDKQAPPHPDTIVPRPFIQR